MKPEHTFVAERALARHCPELLREAKPADDLLPRLAALGQGFATRFARALPSLTGGDPPSGRCGEPRQCNFDEFRQDIGPLAANSLLTLAMPGAAMLVSIEARAILRLIDRAFGGRGNVPAQLPEQFPVSGDLLVAKIEALAIDALCGALGNAGAVSQCRRDGSIARLAPFPGSAALAVMDIAIQEETAGWQAGVAMPVAALPALFGTPGAPRAAIASRAEAPLTLEAPFDDLPLPLRAVLVDMLMPVSTLSALVPGQVLPVAVARNIPLRAGDRTLAHGAIGTMEDRVAVRITHSFQQQELTP